MSRSALATSCLRKIVYPPQSLDADFGNIPRLYLPVAEFVLDGETLWSSYSATTNGIPWCCISAELLRERNTYPPNS